MKEPKKKRGRPSTGSQRQFSIRLPVDLYNALRRVKTKHRRPLNTEITIAIENHCAQFGEWSPPEEPPEPVAK